MNYRLWFYVTVIACFILSGFLIGVTLHAQRVSDHAQQVTNDLKGTRYLMTANALNIYKLWDARGNHYLAISDLDLTWDQKKETQRAVLWSFLLDPLWGELRDATDSLLTNYPEIVDDSLRAIAPDFRGFD